MNASFCTSDGLRQTLLRLHSEGAGSWRSDPEAEALMRFTTEKYGALARKHGLQPDDAAVAAFEVLRTRAARTAGDPWAVVTRAVQITLIADERANGLLCSTSKARRAEISASHDAERFSDRETPICEYHPAFRVPAEQDSISERDPSVESEPTGAWEAAAKAVDIFVALGWPADTTRAALDYVCARLVDAGTRHNAHEALRRDHHARALLDLDRRSWSSLLRLVLGNPNPDRTHTDAGRGLLLLLLIGHSPADLLADDALVRDIHAAAPRSAGASHV